MMKYFVIIFFLVLSSTTTCLCNLDSLHLIATITGDFPGDQFSVGASVGDINGDKYNDFLIGAIGGNYVKLYKGGLSLDTVAYLKFSGFQGIGVRDVNQDGYDDILIADGFYNSSEGIGKKICHLYYGGAPMDTIPDFTFEFQYYLPYGGIAIGSAGDVNADGYADFLIAEPIEPDSYGRSYLFLGGSKIDSLPSLTMVGGTLQDFFGTSLAGSDVNSDGFDDVIVGAPAHAGPFDTGKVFIFYGGLVMDSIPDRILIGRKDFGFNVLDVGDINHDGPDDFIVASSDSSYLYSSVQSTPQAFLGANPGAGGDINNDGFNDFLVGYTNYVNTKDSMVGEIRGYYGGLIVDTASRCRVEGEVHHGQFGYYCTIAGDINGDGFGEVIVGTPSFPNSSTNTGKVYIFSLKGTDAVDEDELSIPKYFELKQNFPNPFNPTTTIYYVLPTENVVSLKVYNVMGQVVRTLIDNARQGAGEHFIEFDASNNPSGVHFYKLQTEGFTALKKMLLLR